MIIIGEKKIGRPTDNPRTEKIGFRLSKQEIKDIEKCAAAMGTQRVNAVTEGIRLLKKELGLEQAKEKRLLLDATAVNFISQTPTRTFL